MVDYKISTIVLGNVTEESITKSSELDVMPMPLSDSDDTQAWDFEGATRNIRITGQFTAATKTIIMDSFITPIETIVNGDQASTVTYQSGFYAEGTGLDGQFAVKLNSFSWRYMTTSPLIIEYDITMTESSI
jgi:hypothetical protein